jgi:hypothetical protein
MVLCYFSRVIVLINIKAGFKIHMLHPSSTHVTIQSYLKTKIPSSLDAETGEQATFLAQRAAIALIAQINLGIKIVGDEDVLGTDVAPSAQGLEAVP